jgi:hypothetical protein
MLHSAAFALGTFEQKTFLLPHNPVHTQLLEQTLWRTHRHNPALMQDGHVQVTGFYGESMNRAALGRYFGIGNGKNSFQVGSSDDAATELDGGYLIHDQAYAAAHAGASTLAGKVTLNPRQTIYGANISYRQSMSGPFAGLFFQASMPIVQVANNLGLTIENPAGVNLGGAQNYSLADYFAGTVNVEAGANAQAGLNKGKMVMGERRATGLADISLQLGYKLICNEDTHFDVSLRGIVPTGTQSTGDYLFEPLVGNNNHFGIGAGIDADATLWHKDGHRLSLQGSAQYTYVLEANEMRMAAIQTRTDAGFKYNQYVAVAAPGAPVNGSQPVLAPAANGLAQQFSVRPGSQLELLTGLGFHSGGLSVNVGYNLNWREQEQVYRKAKDVFAENYAVARKDFSLNTPNSPAVAANGYVGALNSAGVQKLFDQATAPGIKLNAAGDNLDFGGGGGAVGSVVSGGAAQLAIGAVAVRGAVTAPALAPAPANVAIGGGTSIAAVAPANLNIHLQTAGTNAAVGVVNAAVIGGNARAVAVPNSPAAGIGATALLANMKTSYPAMGQLFSATGVDVIGAGAQLPATNSPIVANLLPVAAADNARAVAVVNASTKALAVIQNLQRANVSYADSIRQESMITHVLGGSIGYSFEAQPGFPVMLGLGGQYELPHSTNAGLESYKLFCKLGISF